MQSLKILAAFSEEIDKMILKFIWKYMQGTQNSQNSLKKIIELENSHSKFQNLLQSNSNQYQQNRIENRNKSLHL